MRVYWISDETWDRMWAAALEPLTPRDVLCAGARLRAVNLRSRQFDAGDGEVCMCLESFFVFLADLARPRPWIEGIEPRAFGRPVEEVNRIGRIVLGEGWAGIGALTLCEPEPVRGALTMSAAGALEVML